MLLRRLVTFMTRLVLNALHLNPTLQRGSPITIQTIRPNIKTISNTKYEKLSKLRPNIKNNIQIKTGIFPGDVVLVEPAGDEVVVQRGQEATHLVQSLASSW